MHELYLIFEKNGFEIFAECQLHFFMSL